MPDLPRAKTIIEPFRIKSVEPIRFLTASERGRVIQAAGYNLFKVPAQDVTFDLLTDSGTSAMSARQWAGIMIGDESYAGSPSFLRFEKTVQELTGMENVIPTHQGRSAEFLLMQALRLAKGDVVIGNTHFDTTRANIEHSGAEAIGLPCAETADTQSEAPFKGNIDLDALRLYLKSNSARVRLVIMTVTNNSVGGQPVSRASRSRPASPPYVGRVEKKRNRLSDLPAALHGVFWRRDPGCRHQGDSANWRSCRVRRCGSPAARSLVPVPGAVSQRCTLPSRVYTQSHVDYMIEMIGHLARHFDELRGYTFAYQAPVLRHFTARFTPLA